MSTLAEARSRFHQPDDIDPITAAADEPDFSAEQASEMIQKIGVIGFQRKEQLDAVIKQRGDGSYAVDDAHTGQYGDFYHKANFEYLQKNYPWLHTFNETIGIDDDKAEESHGTLENFLGSIPHEDWQNFITDVEGLDNYPYLDEDRVSELEMEEQGRWMDEDGGPDLIDAMVEDCADGYESYLLSKVTPGMIWEWSRETDNYPESQGDGSVYMDMEKLGKDRENQEWFLEQLEDDVAGWTAIKRAFYDELASSLESGLRGQRVSDQFDQMLRTLATENEPIAAVYHRIDAETLWQMFLQTFPDERREDDDPYWFRWRQNYNLPYEWKAGFAPGREGPSDWQSAYAQALRQLPGTPWFLKLIGTWFDRGPENHPELKFEHLNEAGEDPDDVEMFMRYGGGLAEEIDYEDDKIVVMFPRDFQTLNYHLRLSGIPEINKEQWEGRFRHKDIFVFLGKERPDLTGHTAKRELGIVYGDEDGLNVYSGVSLKQPDLKTLTGDMEYGKSIRRCLLSYYRERVERESKAGTLMQLGGIPELKRAERKGHLDLREFSVQMGLYYVKKHKYALAAKAFNRLPQTITPKGVWLIYDDVSDLTGVFKNPDAAGTVFAHDHHDWFDHYWERGNRPDVSDVIPFLDKKAIEHLRSVMVNRRVFFPDGGPDAQGEYVTLNKKLIGAYDDDTLLDWLAKPSDEDKEDGVWDDIIEAIQLAGVDILSSASQDEVHTGFVKAAVAAIDGQQHKWGTHPTKKTKYGATQTFEVFVPWHIVESWVDTYRENNGGSYDGSLEDLAIDVNADTADPDVNNMEASWRDVNKEWAKENLHRIYELEPPEAYEDPAQVELPLGEAEDADAGLDVNRYVDDLAWEMVLRRNGFTERTVGCHGFEQIIRGNLYSIGEATDSNMLLVVIHHPTGNGRWQNNHMETVPKGQIWQWLKKNVGLTLEAFDPDSPDAMQDKLFSGVPVEFENRVKAILKDSMEAHHYTVSDLTIKYDAALQHSEEAVDASDGRLYNHPPHQILLISYLTEPAVLDWAVTQQAFQKVKAAVTNTYRDYAVADDYILNPQALSDDLPEDLVIFQFSLYPDADEAMRQIEPPGGDPLPF